MNVVVSMMNVDGPEGGRVLMVTCRWRCDGSCCMVTQPAAGDVMVHVVWSPCPLLVMWWFMLYGHPARCWWCDGSCCMVTLPAAGDVMVHVVWSPCLLLAMWWFMLYGHPACCWRCDGSCCMVTLLAMWWSMLYGHPACCWRCDGSCCMVTLPAAGDAMAHVGFAGQYPVMEPGAEFSWLSCTTFSTTYGNMRGSFTMRNHETGQLQG